MAAPAPPAPPHLRAERRIRDVPKLLKATYLTEGEQLLWETRPTRYLYFPGPVLLLLVAGFYNLWVWDQVTGSPIYGRIAFPWLLGGHQFGVDSLEVIVGILLLLAGILFFAIRWFRYASTVYVITSSRLIRQEGIFSRDFKDVQLEQIRGVDVRQTAGERLLGYGRVIVSAESGGPNSLGNEEWPGMVKPMEFEKVVEGAQQAFRPPGTYYR